MRKVLAICLIGFLSVGLSSAKTFEYYVENISEAKAKYNECRNNLPLTEDCNNVIDAIHDENDKANASRHNKRVEENRKRMEALKKKNSQYKY